MISTAMKFVYTSTQTLKIEGYHKNVLQSVSCSEISNLIRGYIQYYFENYDGNKRQLERSMKGLEIILSSEGVYQLSIENISWYTYCRIMHYITSQRDENESIVIGLARTHLCEMYHYVLDNIKTDNQSIQDLKSNRKVLVSTERTIGSNVHQLDKNISTHFPINSSIQNMYFFEFEGKRGKTFTIFNFNLAPEFIKEILKEFIKFKCNRLSPQVASSSFQFFIYHFHNSLTSISKPLLELTDFDFNVFKKQYRFFQKCKEAEKIYPQPSRELIAFYAFLDNYVKHNGISHNVLSYSDYNMILFTSNHFDKFYSSGYRVVKMSKLLDMPKYDRWLVINNENKAQQSNQVSIGIDFTEIMDYDYRNDVKEYMWFQQNAFGSKKSHVLVEFLNIVSNYKRNTINLRNNKEKDKYHISENVLQHYRFVIALKVNNNISTMKSYFKIVRGFLKFHKDKYKFSKLADLVLMVKGEENKGGNPISTEDFKLISDKIQSIKGDSEFNELCYIIFNLAVTTKLRLGEITNLEVNCFIEKDLENGTGKISYHTKLSANEKVEEILPIEKIKLLERAIEITAEVRKTADKDIKDYIFIKKKRLGAIVRFGMHFRNFFSKILSELSSQLEGKYIPYDLRDTFIDTLFSEGIKENLDTLTITSMTGNSSRTALKHYRKSSEIKRYAEIFSGVLISEVNTNGEIIEDSIIKELNPVKEELGACKESSCVVDTDGEYNCLTCNYFATSISRLANFREKIKILKEQKELAVSSKQREFIEVELKLTTAYYTKLLVMRGK